MNAVKCSEHVQRNSERPNESATSLVLGKCRRKVMQMLMMAIFCGLVCACNKVSPEQVERFLSGIQNLNEDEYDEAIKWYMEEAEKGNPIAQNNLGYCYGTGYGVSQDYNEAVKWYRKAAEQGNAYAQYNLGILYEQGNGVSQDYNEAAKLFRKAAEQGEADAQSKLGACYANGTGVPQNYDEAMKWFKVAAEQGDAQALYNMGYCYFFVYGNQEEGTKCLGKAAEKGFYNAQCVYGALLYELKDYDEAVKWLLKAAENDDEEKKEIDKIQFLLGECYAKGNGVQQDYKEAVKWYKKSAELGYAPAVKALNELL